MIAAAFVFPLVELDELLDDDDDEPHPESPSAATPAVAAVPARNVRRESCGCFIKPLLQSRALAYRARPGRFITKLREFYYKTCHKF